LPSQLIYERRIRLVYIPHERLSSIELDDLRSDNVRAYVGSVDDLSLERKWRPICREVDLNDELRRLERDLLGPLLVVATERIPEFGFIYIDECLTNF
jgi:hypothetical protein